MPTQKKIESVKKIKEGLSKSKSVVLTNHTGLTHQQLENLRKNIKKIGGDFAVVKNTLFKRALEGTPFEGKIVKANLQGPTSILLSFDDEITPLRELIKLIREINLPKIKQGALKDRLLDEKDVIRLAELPAEEVILSQLIGMLKSPQTKLVFALKGNMVKLVLVLKALLEKK